MTPYSGIKPGPHLWEAGALTAAPSLLPQNFDTCNSKCHDGKKKACHEHKRIYLNQSTKEIY